MKRILFGLILLLVITTTGIRVAAANDTPCNSPRTPRYGFWMWPAETTIKVHLLSNDFAPEDIPYLLTPFMNWNRALESTASGISFRFEANVDAEQECENCLTIKRGEVLNKRSKHAAELRAYSALGDGIITHATMVIDHKVTNSKMLSNVVAHEIGHNLGLLECKSCRWGTSVMAGFRGINISNGLEGPTGCDIVQVEMAYRNLNARQLAARRELKPPDEGEDPVEDDTPIVMPKP